jgi:hypothetical protein
VASLRTVGDSIPAIELTQLTEDGLVRHASFKELA